MAKQYFLVNLVSGVSKVFEKLLNDRLVDHLKKYDRFYMHHGFRSCKDAVKMFMLTMFFHSHN